MDTLSNKKKLNSTQNYLSSLIKSSILGLAIAAITAANATTTQSETKLLSEPAISKDKLAFIYAGDLWLANKDGSSPKQLTANSADEQAPHFSPDGKWLAYTANHDNNNDVYVVSTDGGQPTRLTWHPESDMVNGWSVDGKKILFTSRREMRHGRSAQAWQVALTGGLPTKVMQAVVQSASWSPDGQTLAYQPYITAHRGASGWRNHRGGSTPPIWILKPGGTSYEEIPHVRASDTNPLWVGDAVYFLSDRNKVKNLYKYNRQSKSVAMVSQESLWDIISADTNGSEIVYEAGGELKLLNTANNKVSDINILIQPDLPELRTQWKDAMPSMENAALSASGKRVLISARGEVFTVPLDKGSTRNLTQTDGVRERDALWSPKGHEIAYTSDLGGVQKLVIRDQLNNKKIRSFELGQPADYSLMLWGGDGTKIIYRDNHLGLWSIDVKKGKTTKIMTNNRRRDIGVSLSSDGRWLAYTQTQANYFADIYLYDFNKKKSYKVTDGMSHTAYPTFSPDGKFLYFTASTNAGPTAVGLDMSTQERPQRSGIYALVLAADGQSPLLAKSDEEEIKSKPDKKGDDKKDADKKDKKSLTTKIDLKNISHRMVALPIAQRAYSDLQVAEDGNLFFIEAEQPGSSVETDGRQSNASHLVRFDFEELKAEKVLDDVNGFGFSADGKVLLLTNSDGELKTAKLDKKLEAKKLNTSEVKVSIDPKKEWQQIFDEVWRTEQQYFYADNMHGLDWKAVGKQFKALLPYVARRADLNTLMVEMIAQMEVGHNRVFGGDMPSQHSIAVGLLGVDLRIKNNLYQIKTVYSGENWNPNLKAPLAAPGIGAKAGDFIHSVNGIAIDASKNIYSLFENTVAKQVTLKVSRDGKLKNARSVIVEPIANDNQLRFWNWIEGNRKAVAAATDGQVGYVYLPDTAGGGFTYFNRMFFAQTDKKAMIIDERRNSGGQAANYITDILSRQYLASWKDRDGMLFDTPGAAIYGPKVMLIDQDAGSGGDFLPYSFKRMGLGKLIGKTTWGGLIGIAANRATIDGGRVLVPFFRFFTPDNEWRVENEGVSPDMEVTLDPVLVNQGRDTQLEAGINEMLKALKTYQPIRLHKAPALPTQLGQ